MKVCTQCGASKPIDAFNKRATKSPDGFTPMCKECNKINVMAYKRTKNGLISKILGDQKKSSIKRGHNMPSYNINTLREWVFSQPNFNSLYLVWVDSGYAKQLVPSIDRLDYYKPYTFENIRITTWGKNKEKGHRDAKKGINNKRSKRVLFVNIKTGESGSFPSSALAERGTGVCSSNIRNVCKGYRATAGDCYWSYA